MSAFFPSSTFELKGKVYFVVVGNYSRWFSIKELRDETFRGVIQALKDLFAIHGIPDLIMPGNCPQYSADSLRQFASKYRFVHTTSSPRYLQANGEVERAVRTVQSMLRNNEDLKWEASTLTTAIPHLSPLRHPARAASQVSS